MIGIYEKINLLLELDGNEEQNEPNKTNFQKYGAPALKVGAYGAALGGGSLLFPSNPNTPTNREDAKKLWNSKWDEDQKADAINKFTKTETDRNAHLLGRMKEIQSNHPDLKMNTPITSKPAIGDKFEDSMIGYDRDKANADAKQKTIDDYYTNNPSIGNTFEKLKYNASDKIDSIKQHIPFGEYITPTNGLYAAGGAAALYGAKKLWNIRNNKK